MSRSVSFFFHSHLPWVLGYGRWPHGTDWLCEATAETYLPLTGVFQRLLRDKVRARAVFSVTPVLAEQLAHPEFEREFRAYLAQKIEAAERDERAFSKAGSPLAALARRWEEFYRGTERTYFRDLGGDLIAAWRELEAGGVIEIATSAATHGYLPLLSSDGAVDRQVAVGVATHQRHFGRAPRAVWLPECAYRPAGQWESPFREPHLSGARLGIEEIFATHGLRYFVVDSHLFRGGRPDPFYVERFRAPASAPFRQPPTIERVYDDGLSIYEPYLVGGHGVTAFARDPRTGRQVWSHAEGYPGDGEYLEFHKKHYPGGLRYWRVTESGSDLGAKQPYDPARAAERIESHAKHFVWLLADVVRGHDDAVVTAAYDTELFGHWWFEGPAWIEAMIRGVVADGQVAVEAPSQVLERRPAFRSIGLPEGSWGDGGGHNVWLNDETRWTWRLVYDAEERMEKARREAAAHKSREAARILREMGRELLLLEASDWQFLITTGTAPDYAERRLRGHYDEFRKLAAIWERFRDSGVVEPKASGQVEPKASGQVEPKASGQIEAEDQETLNAIERRARPFRGVPDSIWRGEGVRVA